MVCGYFTIAKSIVKKIMVKLIFVLLAPNLVTQSTLQ